MNTTKKLMTLLLAVLAMYLLTACDKDDKNENVQKFTTAINNRACRNGVVIFSQSTADVEIKFNGSTRTIKITSTYKDIDGQARTLTTPEMTIPSANGSPVRVYSFSTTQNLGDGAKNLSGSLDTQTRTMRYTFQLDDYTIVCTTHLQFNNVTSKSYGGAITFANCKNVTVKSSSFKKYRSGSGGAIYFMAPECSVVECEFEDGSATSGGAIYTTRDKITVKDSKFKNHTATGHGGVIHISGADAVVDNCEFTDSSSSSNGGIIFVSSSGPGSNISNSKFKSGHATCGGAIYVSARNVIISGNE